MTYRYARFLPKNQKVAFFDASISYCHPAIGLFPHANPSELFVFLGIVTRVFLAGYDLGPLPISYFSIGIVIIFIRGLVTQLIYNAKYKTKYVSDVADSGVTLVDESKAVIIQELEIEETIIIKEVEEDSKEENWVAGGGKALAESATKCVQGGKEAVDITIKDILLFMAFYALLSRDCYLYEAGKCDDRVHLTIFRNLSWFVSARCHLHTTYEFTASWFRGLN